MRISERFGLSNRQVPNGPDEEWVRLRVFYDEVEERSSKQETPNLRRFRWEMAINRYARQGWSLSLVNVEKLWDELTRGDYESVASTESGTSNPLARDAARILFDFSTTPVTFGEGARTDTAIRRCSNPNDRRPPGISVQQEVFLETIHVPNSNVPSGINPADLDEFAVAIADESGYDGVYCLSGLRGTGKSTILNRISWYCQKWLEKIGVALLVRFDLGTSFSRDLFVRDLVAEICLAARRSYRYPPFSLGFGLGWGTRAAGLFGHFSHTNIPWTTIALVLLVVLLQSANMTGSEERKQRNPVSSNDSGVALALSTIGADSSQEYLGSMLANNLDGSVYNSGSSDNDPNSEEVDGTDTEVEKGCSNVDMEFPLKSVLFDTGVGQCMVRIPFLGAWMLKDVELLVLALVGLLTIGLSYRLRIAFYRWRRNNGGRSQSYFTIRLLNYTIATIMIILAFELVTEYLAEFVETFITSAGDGLSAEVSLVRYSAFVGFLAIAVLFVPEWWDSNLILDRTLAKTRAEPNARFLDFPLVGGPGPIGWIVSRLLPTPNNQDQIEKISEPFVQELTKQTLGECTRSFERVVILIDDIDALPSEYFHDILRLIRPMSKTPGIRCVVATPMFFHFALGSDKFGDIHSTIRSSIVVGNGIIYPRWPTEPEKITCDNVRLAHFLVDLVASRFRIALSDDYRITSPESMESLRKSGPIRFILSKWVLEDCSITEKAHKTIGYVGTSRRELIRRIQQSMKGGVVDSGEEGWCSVMTESHEAEFARLKREHQEQEAILNCSAGVGEKVRAKRPRTRRGGSKSEDGPNPNGSN